MYYQNPISSCSKAPRGLSVLSQVTGIFTGITISPSPSSRQRPDRYAFRAGLNLPDKEFRYLRTVIVTAAVHRGFGSKLRLRLPLPLTFRHRAGVSLYTSSFDFAETCVFGKQSPGPDHCGSLTLNFFHANRAPLLPKLRGHFAEFLNEGSLARLRILSSPTCVGFRYGHPDLARGFSWQFGVGDFGTTLPSPSHLKVMPDGFAYLTLYLLGRALPIARFTYPPASPHRS